VSDSLVDFATMTELLVAVAIMAGTVALLVWAILRAAQYQPQAMLVVVLGVLATVSALGYLVGGDARAELVTLAAAAVGALAGALTMLTRTTQDGPGRPQDPGVAPDTTPDPIGPQRPAISATEEATQDDLPTQAADAAQQGDSGTGEDHRQP
jgi:hypothetical protein